MYCPNCRKKNIDSAQFCTECGNKLNNDIHTNTKVPNDINSVPFEGYLENKIYAEDKKPILALILSLIVVGLGQFYNGDVKKGALMLVFAVLGGMSFGLIFSWCIMVIWSAFDAYKVAAKSTPMWK